MNFSYRHKNSLVGYSYESLRTIVKDPFSSQSILVVQEAKWDVGRWFGRLGGDGEDDAPGILSSRDGRACFWPVAADVGRAGGGGRGARLPALRSYIGSELGVGNVG